MERESFRRAPIIIIILFSIRTRGRSRDCGRYLPFHL